MAKAVVLFVISLAAPVGLAPRDQMEVVFRIAIESIELNYDSCTITIIFLCSSGAKLAKGGIS